MKRVYSAYVIVAEYVAPYAGAWIETISVSVSKIPSGVAPYAGAWIETDYNYWTGKGDGRSLRGSVD